jgi:LEA14-like dessication related protein
VPRPHGIAAPRPWAWLAAAGLALTLGCASFGTVLEPPGVTVVSIEPLSATGFEQRFQVDLRLTNPNERPLEVDGLRFDLDVNGQRLARGQTGTPVTVPRLGDALLSVEATTTILDVFKQVMAMQTAKGIRYRVSGRVFLTGLFPPYVDFENEDELVAPPAPAPTVPPGPKATPPAPAPKKR